MIKIGTIKSAGICDNEVFFVDLYLMLVFYFDTACSLWVKQYKKGLYNTSRLEVTTAEWTAAW